MYESVEKLAKILCDLAYDNALELTSGQRQRITSAYENLEEHDKAVTMPTKVYTSYWGNIVRTVTRIQWHGRVQAETEVPEKISACSLCRWKEEPTGLHVATYVVAQHRPQPELT